jgi:hypothetical protein
MEPSLRSPPPVDPTQSERAFEMGTFASSPSDRGASTRVTQPSPNHDPVAASEAMLRDVTIKDDGVEYVEHFARWDGR